MANRLTIKTVAHDGVPAQAGVEGQAEFLSVGRAEQCSAEALPLRSCPLKSCFGALADLFALKLGERRKDGEKHIANQLIVGGQVRLAVAVEADTMRTKGLQVDHCSGQAFPCTVSRAAGPALTCQRGRLSDDAMQYSEAHGCADAHQMLMVRRDRGDDAGSNPL